eukprot:SAG31_NODE_8226_length_1493_cov_14.731707_1_plen_51_part_10
MGLRTIAARARRALDLMPRAAGRSLLRGGGGGGGGGGGARGAVFLLFVGLW